MDNTIQDSIEVYENEIEMYLKMYCEKYNIQDMSKETQNRWNGFLQFAGSKMFKGTGRLKHNPNIDNKYNTEYIYNTILPMYINLCNDYGKEISINGISKLLWLNYDTVMNWSQESSGFGVEIYKKIMQENENSNSDLLSSGKNPIGIAMRLNHIHGWNAPNIRNNELGAAERLLLDDAKKRFEQFQQEKLCVNDAQFNTSQ